MDIKTRILQFVRAHKVVRTADVVRFAGISRQAAARHLRALVATHRLSKQGSTHGARYIPFDPKRAASTKIPGVDLLYRLRGLEENRVWEYLLHRAHLKRKLSAQAFKIVQYAFTQILNNAIEHSRAGRVKIELRLEGGDLLFRVLDRGIGAFQSVRKKFKLGMILKPRSTCSKGNKRRLLTAIRGRGFFSPPGLPIVLS